MQERIFGYSSGETHTSRATLNSFKKWHRWHINDFNSRILRFANSSFGKYPGIE